MLSSRREITIITQTGNVQALSIDIKMLRSWRCVDSSTKARMNALAITPSVNGEIRDVQEAKLTTSKSTSNEQ